MDNRSLHEGEREKIKMYNESERNVEFGFACRREFGFFLGCI